MATEYILTWVDSEERWRKTYRKRQFSYPGKGGKCKTYSQAKEAFDKWKAEIDAELGPGRALADLIRDLERAQSLIQRATHDTYASRGRWESLELLKEELIQRHDEYQRDVDKKLAKGRPPAEPPDLQKIAKNRLEGISVAYPDILTNTARFHDLPSQEEIDRQERERLASRIDSPENQERARAGLDPLSPPRLSDVSTFKTFADPSVVASGPAPWEASTTARIDTLQDLIDAFIADQIAKANAGQRSKGRVGNVRINTEAFADHAGRRTKVENITSDVLIRYRDHLFVLLARDEMSSYTVRDRLADTKAMMNFAYTREVIASLPRCLMERGGFSVAVEIKDPEPITRDEIQTLLHHATDRQRLYLLLGLNCGFQRADISDLKRGEIDLDKGTIIRKRSKTKKHKNAPTVTYKLWPETIAVCKRFLESSGDLAFLAENGSQLITKRLAANGKYGKSDSMDSSWDRLQKKSSIDASFTRLRVTGATWLNRQERFARFRQLYLAHAPSSVADRFYAGADLVGFHEALDAMRDALIT